MGKEVFLELFTSLRESLWVGLVTYLYVIEHYLPFCPL